MRRVLFVDDERGILDGIQRALRSRRTIWEMEFVASGEEALRAHKTKPFDVIVSDLRMPGMDGATLLGIIRDEHPSTARIILSGYSDNALATRSLSVAHRALCKPCDPAELRDAIDRVCALQNVIAGSRILQLVGGVSELPSLSATYARLVQVVEDPRATITDVAALIESDVAMSAKILQIANSAFFGIPQRVTSMRDAAMYLGIATIKNLVVIADIFCALKPNANIPPSFYEDFQRHSARVATIAGALPIDPSLRDITILAAFLHDIGRLFLAWRMPAEFGSALARNPNQAWEALEAEQELFGASHAEIGAYLLGLWGLPLPVVEAIARHHCPAASSSAALNPGTALFCAELLAADIQSHPDQAAWQKLPDGDKARLAELGILAEYPAWRERGIQALRSIAG